MEFKVLSFSILLQQFNRYAVIENTKYKFLQVLKNFSRTPEVYIYLLNFPLTSSNFF